MYKTRSRKFLRIWTIVLSLLSLVLFIQGDAQLLSHAPLLIINLLLAVYAHTSLWNLTVQHYIPVGIVVAISLASLFLNSSRSGLYTGAAISLGLLSYASMRIRTLPALVAGIASLVLFNIVGVWIHIGTSILISVNAQAAACNLLGTITGYHLEYAERINFLNLKKYLKECSLADFEKQKVDFLLNAAIPAAFVERLPAATIADSVNSATVLFIAMDGIISYAETLTSDKWMQLMNELFRRVEARCEQFGCEKVKTFQNKIMIICGAPVPRDDHAVALADLCLAIFQDFEDLQKSEGFKQEYPDLQLKLHAGMSSGPVIAGVIGIKRFCWDVWGDTVNVASRMENPKCGDYNQECPIRVSESTYQLLKDSHECIFSGEILVKGKGKMRSHKLINRIVKRSFERRPSGPKENEIPVLHEIPPVIESEAAVDAQLDSDEEELIFCKENFRAHLPLCRNSILAVIVMNFFLALVDVLIHRGLPQESLIIRCGIVIPWWLLHFAMTFLDCYCYRMSTVMGMVSLNVVIIGDALAQYYLRNPAVNITLAHRLLSNLNLACYLSYTMFSFCPEQVTFLLVTGMILQGITWSALGFRLPSSALSALFFFVVATILSNLWVSHELYTLNRRNWKLERIAEDMRREFVAKRKKVIDVLKNIVPDPYLEEVSHSFTQIRRISRSHKNVVVLCSDVVGFTQIAANMGPVELVESLNDLFTRFDRLTEIYKLEKIKTIGDAYVACGGLFPSLEVDVLGLISRAIEMACDMHECVKQFNGEMNSENSFKIRIGVHVGNLYSGILGHSKFQFDIFGETLAIADELERSGREWQVHVSDVISRHLHSMVLLEAKPVRYRFLPGPPITLAGKEYGTYFLSRKSERNLNSPRNVGVKKPERASIPRSVSARVERSIGTEDLRPEQGSVLNLWRMMSRSPTHKHRLVRENSSGL